MVEAIIILPQKMFYTTDISVTLWILNKNKDEKTVNKGTETRNYRKREEEILFMDLRQQGEPFEKKYIQFSPTQIQDIAQTFHTWQTDKETYEDIPEYCYSANKKEVEKKDFSLVPSKYIDFVNRDENIDFDTKMKGLQTELKDILAQETQSKADLQNVFKTLGYEL
jgi:type I restriction enzyme M protein